MKYLFISSLVFLTHCAYLSVDRKLPKVDLPQSYENSTLDPSTLKEWWRHFDDPALNELIEYARKNNTDLMIAAAKIDEARAVLGIAKSEKLPRLDARASATRMQSSEYVLTPNAPNPFDDYQLAAQASWELDLWGRIRNSTSSARSNLLAQHYNQEVILLSLYSDIAQAYFNLCTLDTQLEITKNTIASRKQSFELQRKRLSGGFISEQDAIQAEVELATAKSSLPDLQKNIATAESILNILIGASPRDIIEKNIARGKSLEKISIPPSIPKTLPSDLLLLRPDIQQAEQTLLFNRANIAVARAAYFPKISLTGLLGMESLDINKLFNSSAQMWSYGVGLTTPLFNNGLIASQVAQASAREQAAVAGYRRTISQAFSDVKTSLEVQKFSALKVQALKDQTEASQELYRLADIRYNNGYENYLNVLDAQRSLYQAQLLNISAQRDHLISIVSLYKSLGGGWVREDHPKKDNDIMKK